MAKEKKKYFEGMKIPHTYVIISSIVLLAFIATYLVPAGVYQRVTDPVTGRSIIDPSTFKYVENTPVKFFSITEPNLFTSVVTGLKNSASIVFFTFLVCGSFHMMQKTGAIEGGIARIALLLRNKSMLLIPIVVFVFSIGGVTIGMNTEAIAFVPLGIVMARALGFDAMVGMAIVALGAGVGFVGGFVNPFTVGVAQQVSQLPIYSGLGYRVVVYVILYIITCIYIIRYAKKVKENPEKSVVRDLELSDNFSIDFEALPKLTNSQKLVLVIFFLGFGSIIYGVLKHGWGTDELISIFMLMGISSSFVCRISPSQAAENFIEGAKDVLFGALSIGIANAVLVVLQQGQVIDSILYSLSTAISHLPGYVSVILMYITQIFTNIFIPSGSGQAATTMPIMAPLGDLLGISRQTTVLAFQYGDGFTNYINPTASGLMSYLAIAKIPYEKWVKWMGPLMAIWLSLGGVAVIIAYLINYQ